MNQLNPKQMERLMDKVDQLASVYQEDLAREICVLPAQCAETEQSLYTPPAEGYRPIAAGERWGAPGGYGWFRVRIEADQSLAGNRSLAVEADTGAVEHLVYVNGEPRGMLDWVRDAATPWFRIHRFFRLPELRAGEALALNLEGYCSHPIPNCEPYDRDTTFALSVLREQPEFRSVRLVEIREEIREFLNNLHFLNALRCAELAPYARAEVETLYEGVFSRVYRSPADAGWERAREAVAACNAFLRDTLPKAAPQNKPARPTVSAVGHSHMDTAWLWDTEETKHKLARTCALALDLMDRFPEYTFVQSSTLHYEWMKQHYPTLYARLKERVAEGRYDCNGGSYVECDANLTGGEAMIRHFVLGQTFLKEEFGRLADTYWLPDTFGYSAAIPQILQGCRIAHFMTTKINGNDTNRFPYDTFRWKGIDGSEVLCQFNVLQCYADPATAINRANFVEDKRSAPRTLLSYGFGDGGGGPSEDMVRIADMTAESALCPRLEHVTVSEHMRRLEQEAGDLPVYDGELYFESHRGTFTTMSDIKRANRRLEFRLLALEVLSAMTDKACAAELDAIWRLLLLNQFHDILPGTAIESAHRSAMRRYEEAFARADALQAALVEAGRDTLYNTLSWERTGNVCLPGRRELAGRGCDSYVDLAGETQTVVHGLVLPAAGAVPLKEGTPAAPGTWFHLEGKVLTTPYYRVAFDETGAIASLVDLAAGRELVAPGGRMNALLCGEDMPLHSDNWDVDADVRLRMEEQQLLSQETLDCGGHFRIRSHYRIANQSELAQDVVFYADDSRIDFENLLEWRDCHRLVQAAFDADIRANVFRSEIQFGCLERSVKDNTSVEQAMFEVCNHKWTDLSEPGYGISLFNDCKYGVSVRGGRLTLTLQKSGTHPDATADRGRHAFRYALWPHAGGFSADVVRRAYEFNVAPLEGAKTPLRPLPAVENPNVILETVKPAQDGRGRILRLYECEGTKTNLVLRFPAAVKVTECNLLEEALGAERDTDCWRSVLRPFRILTLRVR